MNSNVTPEQHSTIHSLTKDGHSASEIARVLGLGKTSVRKYRALPVDDVVTESVNNIAGSQEITADTWTINLPRTRISSEAELVAQCAVDTSIWAVDKLFIQTTDKGTEHEPVFMVKAWLKKKVKVDQAKKEIEALKDDAKTLFSGKLTPIHIPRPSGNLLEIAIPDLHVGKLAWSGETGYADYDIKIACDIFETALATLISRASSYDFEEIVFPVGNDLLNCDSKANTTTGGTPQDVDSRYQKTFRTTRLLITAAINRLREIAPVRVLMVPGNHDNETTWHLGDSLECLFDKQQDVFVDNTATSRKYMEFGKVMLMHCHGHQGKRADYPLLMATERPEMFGRTKFRECHTGHLHQVNLIETHGVRVRILPSLSGTDAYHATNGYTGNLRQAEGYIWNKEEGLLGTAVYTV